MKLTPYLNFNGQCAEAFKLYEQCLGGKITFMMTHGESPMADQAPPGWGEKIMHATLTLGDQLLQGADSFPNHYQQPQGITVTIALNDTGDAERIFQALSQDGSVQMPLQETFWAKRFGMCVDRFGIPWMVNCENPA